MKHIISVAGLAGFYAVTFFTFAQATEQLNLGIHLYKNHVSTASYIGLKNITVTVDDDFTVSVSQIENELNKTIKKEHLVVFSIFAQGLGNAHPLYRKFNTHRLGSENLAALVAPTARSAGSLDPSNNP